MKSKHPTLARAILAIGIILVALVAVSEFWIPVVSQILPIVPEKVANAIFLGAGAFCIMWGLAFL